MFDSRRGRYHGVMTTPLTYDFGYSWWIGWGHLVPIALFGGLAALALWRRWHRWLIFASALLALWGVVGLLISQFLFRLNLPVEPPTPLPLVGNGAGRRYRRGIGPCSRGIAARTARSNGHGRRYLQGVLRDRGQHSGATDAQRPHCRRCGPRRSEGRRCA